MTGETTWAAQLAASDGIDIRPVPEGRRGMTPGRSMLYPSARIINDVIRELPAGTTITPKELRAMLAERHDVEYTCPVTTTRALRIVAEAANEARVGGVARDGITPVWRVLDARAPALRMLTFDPAWILEERTRES